MEKSLLVLTIKTLKKLGYEVDELGTNAINFRNKQILGEVAMSKDGECIKIRISAVCDFDRWANSTAIEKMFDTQVELVRYLRDNQVEIYKEVIDYLAELIYSDYEEEENGGANE